MYLSALYISHICGILIFTSFSFNVSFAAGAALDRNSIKSKMQILGI